MELRHALRIVEITGTANFQVIGKDHAAHQVQIPAAIRWVASPREQSASHALACATIRSCGQPARVTPITLTDALTLTRLPAATTAAWIVQRIAEEIGILN